MAGHSSENPLLKDTLQVDSILLASVSEEQAEHSFDLSQLEPGEEVIIPSHANHRSSDDSGDEMSVVFAFKQKNSILMRCSCSRPR